MIGFYLINESRKKCSETKQIKKKADGTRASTHNSKSLAVRLIKEGLSTKEIAKRTKVSITTINKYATDMLSQCTQ